MFLLLLAANAKRQHEPDRREEETDEQQHTDRHCLALECVHQSLNAVSLGRSEFYLLEVVESSSFAQSIALELLLEASDQCLQTRGHVLDVSLGGVDLLDGQIAVPEC